MLCMTSVHVNIQGWWRCSVDEMFSSCRWWGSTTVRGATVTLCVRTSVGWQGQTQVTPAAAVCVNWSLLSCAFHTCSNSQC